MTNSDAAYSKGFRDEYQRAIAVSDRAWDHLQFMIQEHGMAADITTVAREAYLHTVTAENAAYDLLKGNS